MQARPHSAHCCDMRSRSLAARAKPPDRPAPAWQPGLCWMLRPKSSWQSVRSPTASLEHTSRPVTSSPLSISDRLSAWSMAPLKTLRCRRPKLLRHGGPEHATRPSTRTRGRRLRRWLRRAVHRRPPLLACGTGISTAILGPPPSDEDPASPGQSPQALGSSPFTCSHFAPSTALLSQPSQSSIRLA